VAQGARPRSQPEPADASGKAFREACCERLGLAPTAFEEFVLWQCFCRRGRALGKALWRLRPGYFKRDLELIQRVADCTSLRSVRSELRAPGGPLHAGGLLRRMLKVRLSGQRLLNLAAEFMQ
jgi:hypothetical protein